MDDVTKAKIAAGAKIAVGAARMGGAVATATGHGMIGGFLKQRHLMNAAVRIGKRSFEGGKKMLDEGLADWKRADS